jgi:aminoglycoside/choline kinase family phosphotransferase
MDDRFRLMERWLRQTLGNVENITPASADASFRRYFRIVAGGTTHIVMDAPPEREDSRPFVRVAKLFADIGLNVPRIIAADMEHGLLLLTDLGERC